MVEHILKATIADHHYSSSYVSNVPNWYVMLLTAV